LWCPTSDSTRHHKALALERLQKFALDNKLLDRPAFGKLEKPRIGQRDRLPTAEETAAILSQASPEFRLIYSALRQCGARPVELCRTRIADVDRANCVITHECGTKICREKGIECARRLLGHANISTTQRYVHLDDRELADAQDLVE